jgi:C4-dicarboxylate transporter DctM subunit
MTDGTWVTLISLGVTMLFMMGVPVLLVIAYWVIGCSVRAWADARQYGL